MNKSTKKKRTYYKVDVLKRVAKKFDVSVSFVTKSLRGERTSDRAELCVKEYKVMTKNVANFINNQ